MQFHPTCLYNLEVKNFLITEAVRGEGGQLKLPPGVKGGGKRFMPQFDERAELAPRDIVARAIDHEIKRLGLDYVHLDISHRDPEFVRAHFPNIYEKLLGLGIDITREPIPVVPAQHYTCGGVVVDLDGRTDAPGLYAAGEVTQSGLHGANRLASNSLLECLVFGEAAAQHIVGNFDALPEVPHIRGWDESRVTDSDEEVVIAQTWGEIRRFMWNYVGIVRTTKRLERAKHRIDMLRREVRDYYAHFRVTPDLIELRNLVEVADLIIRSALVAPREPRPSLHARFSRDSAGGQGHGAGAIRSQRPRPTTSRAIASGSGQSAGNPRVPAENACPADAPGGRRSCLRCELPDWRPNRTAARDPTAARRGPRRGECAAGTRLHGSCR